MRKKIFVFILIMLFPFLVFSVDYIPSSSDDLSEGATNLFYTNERVDDEVGNNLLSNSSTITWTYDDGTGKVTGAVSGFLTSITGAGLDNVFTGTSGLLKKTGTATYTLDTSTYLTAEVDGSTTNEIQNIFQTVAATSGSTTANSSTDTLTVTGSGIVSTSITGDTLTIVATEVDGSTTNEIQDLSLTNDTLALSGDVSTVSLSGYYNSLSDLQSAVTNDFHNLGGTDANTTYTAGTDLDLTDTTFSLETTLNSVTDIDRASNGNLTLSTSADGDDIILSPMGNVGIGTTATNADLTVLGTATVSGNVGIGTTSTAKPLTVVGEIQSDALTVDGFDVSKAKVKTIWAKKFTTANEYDVIKIPVSGTIVNWTVMSIDDTNQTAQFDILVGDTASIAGASSITASAKPSITTAKSATSSTLTDWTTALTEDKFLFVELESITGTGVNLQVEVEL